MRPKTVFKAIFQSVADRLQLTPEQDVARRLHSALLPVGLACEKYIETAGTGEFYHRLHQVLLKKGWPANPNYPDRLNDDLSGLVWELSVGLEKPTSGTLDIRLRLEVDAKQHGGLSSSMTFILDHLSDIETALAVVSKGIDAEIASKKDVRQTHNPNHASNIFKRR